MATTSGKPGAPPSDLDAPEVAAASPGEPIGACPRCEAPFEASQEYCLECGLRLPVTGAVIPGLASAWTRRVRWYPGDWLWPALLFLLIAALGATVAILATRDDELPTLTATSPPGQTATSPTGTQAGTDTLPTETAVAPPAPGATTPAAITPPSPPPPPAVPVEWPAGEGGYTVVLASIPTSDGREAASVKAQEALDAGLSDVGVLDSSEYSSLHPGYYVVFAGIEDSLDDALAAAEEAKTSGFAEAYARQITP